MRAIADIPEQRFEPRNAAAVAIALFRLLQAAELDERLATRFFGSHPAPEIVLDMHLDMALELLGQLAVLSPFVNQAAPPHEPATQSPHKHPPPGRRHLLSRDLWEHNRSVNGGSFIALRGFDWMCRLGPYCGSEDGRKLRELPRKDFDPEYYQGT